MVEVESQPERAEVSEVRRPSVSRWVMAEEASRSAVVPPRSCLLRGALTFEG